MEIGMHLTDDGRENPNACCQILKAIQILLCKEMLYRETFFPQSLYLQPESPCKLVRMPVLS